MLPTYISHFSPDTISTCILYPLLHCIVIKISLKYYFQQTHLQLLRHSTCLLATRTSTAVWPRSCRRPTAAPACTRHIQELFPRLLDPQRLLSSRIKDMVPGKLAFLSCYCDLYLYENIFIFCKILSLVVFWFTSKLRLTKILYGCIIYFIQNIFLYVSTFVSMLNDLYFSYNSYDNLNLGQNNSDYKSNFPSQGAGQTKGTNSTAGM